MNTGKDLIDKAVATVVPPSQYELARRLGVDKAFLSRVYRGIKPMPPLMAAELASLTGDDPREAALAAEIEQVSPEKRPHYERLFKMAHAAGVAALVIGTGLAALPAQRAEAHNAPHRDGKQQRFETDRFRQPHRHA